jgi:hypothetical protein
MDDCLKHYEDITDVEYEWYNYEIYTAEKSRKNVIEHKIITKYE